MKILLTGGTGFIGSHVLMQLLQQKHEVTVLARNINKIPYLNSLDNIIIEEGSLDNYHKLKQLVKNKDAVIHMALNYNDTSAFDMLQADTMPAVYLATEASEAGVKHFIYTSSTAVNDNVYMTEQPRIEGGNKHNVFSYTKQNPVTYYGATKAAVENFLMAISAQSNMQVNIVRPGYVFGNPALKGGSTQPDTRFKDIVNLALNNESIEVIKNDGTQFISAKQIAVLYLAILNSNKSGNMYFGLSKRFISWEEIAYEAIRICQSESEVIVQDLGWSNDPVLFDVSAMKKDFNFEFDANNSILEHLNYFKSLTL